MCIYFRIYHVQHQHIIGLGTKLRCAHVPMTNGTINHRWILCVHNEFKMRTLPQEIYNHWELKTEQGKHII